MAGDGYFRIEQWLDEKLGLVFSWTLFTEEGNVLATSQRLGSYEEAERSIAWLKAIAPGCSVRETAAHAMPDRRGVRSRP
jgi:hypothetical protein